jgi:hypothetical protein
MPIYIVPLTNGLTRTVTGVTAGNEPVFPVNPRNTVSFQLIPTSPGSASIVAENGEEVPTDLSLLPEDPGGPFSVAILKNLGDKLNYVAPRVYSGTFTVKVTS